MLLTMTRVMFIYNWKDATMVQPHPALCCDHATLLGARTEKPRHSTLDLRRMGLPLTLLLVGRLCLARAQEDDDSLEWIQAFSGMMPFLVASFFIILSLYLLLFPQCALRALMMSYLEDGQLIMGRVLSCETKAGSGGDVFIVEVMYETTEHKFAHNASMKFRNPEAFERKQLCRRFEFDREIPRGAPCEVLLPTGPNGTRSGCPKEVIEKIFYGYSNTRTFLILMPGLILLAICIGMAVREVLAMDDPGVGWLVLFGWLGASAVLSFLFCADQFFKMKRRRFDAARPMISHTEQSARIEAKSNAIVSREELLNPFSVPLHEFAGHARASERGQSHRR